MVAALFVQEGGAYYGLENVDPWPESRDARKYAGPHPVICHPPCSRWCQLAHVNQKRYGHRVGDDGGCFESALASVRRWGGVLEHPARSYAWKAFALPPPAPGRWRHTDDDVSVCEVAQSAYGHPAQKLTWLLRVGAGQPQELDWSRPAPSAQVSFLKNHGNSPLPRLSKKAASATPPPIPRRSPIHCPRFPVSEFGEGCVVGACFMLGVLALCWLIVTAVEPKGAG